MSKYQVTVSSTNNYNVTFTRTDRKQIVDVDEAPQQLEGNLSTLDDVNTSGRLDQYVVTWDETQQSHVYSLPVAGTLSGSNDVDTSNRNNNYVLIWNETLQKHEYVSPFEILDRADGTDDDSLDYGTY